MAKELVNDESSLELLRLMQDFTNWFIDDKDYKDGVFREKEILNLESQEQYFDFMRTDFTNQIINSINNLSEKNDKTNIDVVVSGLDNITSLQTLTMFLSSEAIQAQDFVSQIDNQLNNLTSDIIPSTIYKLDNLNGEIETSFQDFNNIFLASSNELKLNLEDTNTTIDEYINNVSSSMSSNVSLIDNTLSNTLGGVGKGLGSFISQFAIQTSTALPILGTNISLFFTALSNPASLLGIGATTLAIMGLGVGLDLMGDGIIKAVNGFEDFVDVITSTDDIGKVATDMIKIAGGVTTLNLALTGTLLSAPTSFLGLLTLTGYLNSLGETYRANEDSLDSMIDLFENLNSFASTEIDIQSIDEFVKQLKNIDVDLEFDSITENLNNIVNDIDIIDLNAKLNIINIDEFRDIELEISLNDVSLENITQQLKQVEISKIQPSITNIDDVLNPRGEINNQYVNQIDTFEMVSELKQMNRTLEQVLIENVNNKKETKESLRRATFYGAEVEEVSILDKIAGMFG